MLIHLAAAGPFRRSRAGLTLLIAVVIAIGLASRRGYMPFPAVLGNYPGDALWAWVVLLCVAWLRPAVTRGKLMAWSLVIAFAIEFLQLYQAPWMQALRAKVVSAHVMGGCALSPDAKDGVANLQGRHHQLDKLSIIDGSIFPTSIGANPQLSIYAFAARLAEGLASELKGR